jgi:hypothetical protein
MHNGIISLMYSCCFFFCCAQCPPWSCKREHCKVANKKKSVLHHGSVPACLLPKPNNGSSYGSISERTSHLHKSYEQRLTNQVLVTSNHWTRKRDNLNRGCHQDLPGHESSRPPSSRPPGPPRPAAPRPTAPRPAPGGASTGRAQPGGAPISRAEAGIRPSSHPSPAGTGRPA